jgi:hypothetical protein
MVKSGPPLRTMGPAVAALPYCFAPQEGCSRVSFLPMTTHVGIPDNRGEMISKTLPSFTH